MYIIVEKSKYWNELWMLRIECTGYIFLKITYTNTDYFIPILKAFVDCSANKKRGSIPFPQFCPHNLGKKSSKLKFLIQKSSSTVSCLLTLLLTLFMLRYLRKQGKTFLGWKIRFKNSTFYFFFRSRVGQVWRWSYCVDWIWKQK